MIEFSFYDKEKNEDVECFINVIEYTVVKGNPYTWDSDWDYYGYEDIDYSIVDADGNEIEITQEQLNYIDDKVCETIRKYYQKQNEE